MLEKDRIILIISIIIVVALTSSLVYVYKTKTDGIGQLNIKIEQLNQKIESLESESFHLKFACLSSSDCKNELNIRVRNSFLGRHSLDSKSRTATYQNVEKDINYISLPLNLRKFIEKNCPNEIYTTPGILLSKYIYKLYEDDKRNSIQTKFVEILMHDATVEIQCSWIKDESTGSFNKIK